MNETSSSPRNWRARSAAQPLLDATRTSSHPRCLICGHGNPSGLKLDFRVRRDGSVSASFFCDELLQSYPGTLHGGVISAVLDSAMTNCLFSLGITAVTGEISIRFLRPVSLDSLAEVTAAVEKSRGPLHVLRAELTQNRELMARASAKFLEKTCAVNASTWP